MSPAVAARVDAHFAVCVPALSDTAFFWIQVVMVVGIALAVIATYFIARSNKRLGERIERRRHQKREEAHAAGVNAAALAGRPQVPARDESGTPAVND